MIRRTLEDIAVRRATQFPVVVITGPRQSGKTTFCRAVFRGHAYASLEPPDVREYATADPRGFLAQYPDGAILDEVQRVPELLSYIQDIVDRRRRNGMFVLTGSQHFGLLEAVTQSLAGRSGLLHLFPFSLDEIRRIGGGKRGLWDTIFRGSYPRIHEQQLDPETWLASYTATYLERDVRQVLQVGDLATFQTFVRLCAGRTAQLVNLSALGNDTGVSHNTARAWISVLETGFVVHRLQPLHGSRGKRLVKTPKLHFYDAGLLCYLLGIRSPSQLRLHPLRGAIFESWVASEILKARFHRGRPADMAFYRDRKGNEVDVWVDAGERAFAVEAKSGSTVATEAIDAIASFAESQASPAKPVEPVLLYGGDGSQRRTRVQVLSWSEIDRFDWADVRGDSVRERARTRYAAPGRAKPRRKGTVRRR